MLRLCRLTGTSRKGPPPRARCDHRCAPKWTPRLQRRVVAAAVNGQPELPETDLYVAEDLELPANNNDGTQEHDGDRVYPANNGAEDDMLIGFGEPDVVQVPLDDSRNGLKGDQPTGPGGRGFMGLPSEFTLPVGFLVLATSVTAIAIVLPDAGFDALDSLPVHVLWALKAVLMVLAVYVAWPAIYAGPYQALKKLPKSADSQEPSCPPTAGEGFGEPDVVILPSDTYVLLCYVVLATAVSAIALAIPDSGFESVPEIGLSVLKGFFTALAVCSWPAVYIFPYQAISQRPKMRFRVVRFFRKVRTGALDTVEEPPSELGPPGPKRGG